MPLPKNVPIVPPVPAVLPTKQYPHLKTIINEVDFLCSSCSSAFGFPVWRTWDEAIKDPISGPAPSGGGSVITPRGMMATRFQLRCPDCNTVPESGDFIQAGIIDLLSIPKGYKKAVRPVQDMSSGLSMEEEGETPVAAVRGLEAEEPKRSALGKGRFKKKATDLNKKSKPKSEAERARAIAAKVPKSLLQAAVDSNQERPEIGTAPKPGRKKK